MDTETERPLPSFQVPRPLRAAQRPSQPSTSRASTPSHRPCVPGEPAIVEAVCCNPSFLTYFFVFPFLLQLFSRREPARFSNHLQRRANRQLGPLATEISRAYLISKTRGLGRRTHPPHTSNHLPRRRRQQRSLTITNDLSLYL